MEIHGETRAQKRELLQHQNEPPKEPPRKQGRKGAMAKSTQPELKLIRTPFLLANYVTKFTDLYTSRVPNKGLEALSKIFPHCKQ